MEKNDIVLKTLAGSPEPLKAGDIAEKSGIDKKDVDKAIKALTALGKIESPRRCFYSAKK